MLAALFIQLFIQPGHGQVRTGFVLFVFWDNKMFVSKQRAFNSCSSATVSVQPLIQDSILLMAL